MDIQQFSWYEDVKEDERTHVPHRNIIWQLLTSEKRIGKKKYLSQTHIIIDEEGGFLQTKHSPV